ncbi:hypothetical protein HHI36_005619 [Cryptolaemus montrouzieri]|uniref:Cytochrome c oxidase assembly protein COX20, mitochondrial n=1 Tax=Cryptolaemus montrouzieri TaxID=559131 RepID=A0ABD2NVJ8_9CUCU
MGKSDENSTEPDNRSLFLFGTDVSKVPCFRSTMLNSILGGIGCGLSYFMFSSRIKASTDVAMGSYILIALGYWIHCRYNYGKAKFEMMRLQEAVALATVLDGSEFEKKLDAGQKVDV